MNKRIKKIIGTMVIMAALICMGNPHAGFRGGQATAWWPFYPDEKVGINSPDFQLLD